MVSAESWAQDIEEPYVRPDAFHANAMSDEMRSSGAEEMMCFGDLGKDI